ncbi:hypothetical protein EDD16DRAFT_1524065 [Pisolithus croceorrhizus]|nr:hypothetical protein EDD16DRAFT_1524065 [Pisolithus croceorrhizus]KAI6107420.1 hypothetical protein EV401DRAFT_1892050 [Pisolithus croceorrhizus]
MCSASTNQAATDPSDLTVCLAFGKSPIHSNSKSNSSGGRSDHSGMGDGKSSDNQDGDEDKDEDMEGEGAIMWKRDRSGRRVLVDKEKVALPGFKEIEAAARGEK